MTASLFPIVLLCLCSVPSQTRLAVGESPPWPICGQNPIPQKRLKDKLNSMPCNQLSRLLCSIKHSVSRSSWTCVICVEIPGQHFWRLECDNKYKIINNQQKSNQQNKTFKPVLHVSVFLWWKSTQQNPALRIYKTFKCEPYSREKCPIQRSKPDSERWTITHQVFPIKLCELILLLLSWIRYAPHILHSGIRGSGG